MTLTCASLRPVWAFTSASAERATQRGRVHVAAHARQVVDGADQHLHAGMRHVGQGVGRVHHAPARQGQRGLGVGLAGLRRVQRAGPVGGAGRVGRGLQRQRLPVGQVTIGQTLAARRVRDHAVVDREVAARDARVHGGDGRAHRGRRGQRRCALAQPHARGVDHQVLGHHPAQALERALAHVGRAHCEGEAVVAAHGEPAVDRGGGGGGLGLRPAPGQVEREGERQPGAGAGDELAAVDAEGVGVHAVSRGWLQRPATA